MEDLDYMRQIVVCCQCPDCEYYLSFEIWGEAEFCPCCGMTFLNPLMGEDDYIVSMVYQYLRAYKDLAEYYKAPWSFSWIDFQKYRCRLRQSLDLSNGR